MAEYLMAFLWIQNQCYGVCDLIFDIFPKIELRRWYKMKYMTFINL